MCERNICWLPFAHPQLGTWPATLPCALTGNRTVNLLVLRLALSPLSHTSQGALKPVLTVLDIDPHHRKPNMP